MSIPLDCAQLFSELTTEIQSAPPDRVSEILYEAGNLMLLAGEGRSAYQAFTHLLNGEFALNQSSPLTGYLEAILPSLCHGLGISCPKTPKKEAMDIEELDAVVREKEQDSRAMTLLDPWNVQQLIPAELQEFAPPPMPFPTWDEDYILRIIGEKEPKPELSEIHKFLQDAFRFLQVFCRVDQFEKAIELIKIYKLVCQRWDISQKDWISSEVRVISLDTYLQVGRHEEAKEILLNWWDSSDRQSYEINKFLYIIAARDLIWDGLFKKKVNITLEAIALFFEALANHSYTPQLGGIPTVSDWEKFIEKWNTKTFSEEFDEEHDFWSERFPEEIKQKKCSRPPATELEVLDLEEKLGISLPTSYRNFLLCSNGWLFLYEHIEFLGTTSIDWYSAPNQKWADLYKEIDEFEISDEEYFQYGKYQDCISMRYEYLDALLRISEECEYEYALNPMVIDDRGEWEAWDLSGKHPGAFRYQSFWEMMQATYKRCFEKD